MYYKRKQHCRDLIEAEKGRPVIILRRPTQETSDIDNMSSPNTPITPDVTPSRPDATYKNDYVRCPIPTIYFKDGIRSVDYVLVWDAFEEEAVTEKAYQRRKIFELNLIREGLDLEYEPQEKNGLNFIKVRWFYVF